MDERRPQPWAQELINAAEDYVASKARGEKERIRAMFRLFKAAPAYVREQTKVKDEALHQKRSGRRRRRPTPAQPGKATP